MFTPKKDESGFSATTKSPADSDASQTNKSPSLSLEGVILSLLSKARKIAPDASENIVAPLVYEFEEYYKEIGIIFSISIESLLSLDLSIDVDGAQQLQERINCLHFIYFKVLPKFAGTLNSISLKGMIGYALEESIDKYCILPIAEIEYSNVILYDEISIRLEFPAIVSKCDEYEQVLTTLKNNLQAPKTHGSTKYTLEKFEKNLEILFKNTQSQVLPKKMFTGEFHKHVDSVFFIIGFLKDCYVLSDAVTLLPKVEQLLLELYNKLSSNEYPKSIKTLGLKIYFLAKSTAMLAKEIKDNHPAQTLILSEKLVNETVQALFEEDIALLPSNEKFTLLFSNLGATKKITEALTTRLAKEIAGWPSIDTITPEQAIDLLTSCQVPINLTLFFIEDVLANRPELLSECFRMTAELYAQTSYYFIIANRHFKSIDDYTAKDAKYFAALQQYYHALDKHISVYNKYILENAKAIKEKTVNIQMQQLYKQQIYAAHHNVLTYKLCYAIICSSVHEYDLAKKACQATQEASWDVNGTIDQLDENIDRMILKDYQDLLAQIQKKLEVVFRQTSNHARVKAALSKQEKNAVVYVCKDNTINSVDINEIINRISKATKDVLPDASSAEHLNITKYYSQRMKVHPVRLAMIESIIERYKFDSKDEMSNKPRLPQERVRRINQYQENVNTIYYFICTLVKEQKERFPEADTMHRFLGLLIVNTLMQAKELEKLLLECKVPDGQYAELYKLVHGNYQVLSKDLETYIKDVRNYPEERVGKLKSLIEFQAVYVCIFEQFADSVLANMAFNQGLELLKTLKVMCNISPEELNKYSNLLANAKSFELPNPVFAQNYFKEIYDKSIAIHSFLKGFGNLALQQKPLDENAQKIFENLKNELNKSKSNPGHVADIVLKIKKDIGSDNAVALLTELKEYFEIKKQYYFSQKIGALGLFAEVLIGIIIDIDTCLRQLDEQAKLQVQNAQKQAKILAQKEIERAKREVQIQQDKLRKEIRKQELKEKQSQAAQIKSVSVQDQTLASKEKPKVTQRPKQKDVNPGDFEIKPEIDITEFKEPKLTKKKRRLLEKAQMQEQERQERVTKQKQAQAQIRKSSRLKQVIENAGALGDISEIKVIEAKLRQAQFDKAKKQEAPQSNKIDVLTEDVTDITKAVSNLNLADDKYPSIKQKIAQLEQFFTKERLQLGQSNLPDEAFKMDDIQIEIQPNEKRVLDLFHAHGIRAYLFGGYPRDVLLGREPHDADFVVFCTTQKAKALLGENCVDNKNNPGKQLVFNGADVRCEDESLTLLAFAKERDITINALLVGRDGYLYAPIMRSVADLENTELVPIGNTMETFKADPRRMYRIIRQSHELQGNLSISAEQALLENAHLLTNLPFKDYRHHFSSLFLRGWALSNILYINKLEILARIFPPLQSLDCKEGDLLSWIELECIKMDQLEKGARKQVYSFNKIIAIFLAPVVKMKMCFLTQQNLDDVLNQTISEFFKTFPGAQPSDIEKTVMSNIIKAYYVEYLKHIQRQANLRQAKLTVLEPASATLTPQYRKSPPVSLPSVKDAGYKMSEPKTLNRARK